MPLRDVVVFPYMVIPLLVGRPASLAAIDTAIAEDRWIFLVAQRSADVNEPGAKDLFRTGVIGRVLQIARNPNGTTKVLVEGVGRARVTRYSHEEKHLRAQIEPRPFRDHPPTPDEHAQIRRVVTLFDEYVGMHRRIPGEVASLVQSAQSVDKQAFAIAAHLLVKLEQRQKLLEAPNMRALSELLGETLVAENEILRLERKIDNDVRGSLFQNQREFYLQEQLKAIHKELGQEEADGFDELQAAIEKKGFPAPVKERADRELRKLRRTSPLSPEATVGRNYLDWLIALPWNERSDDVVDVAHARAVLDEDHYGLEDVKDRILDYIAVLALVGKMEGPILCLVGPPGVGKTSLGRSIARALGRKFVRMSLGGVRDEAEIRGHRRTYIGVAPRARGAGDAALRGREPGDPARRGGQARPGLARRSGGGAARGARSRAEQGVQRSLPRSRLRPVAGALPHDREHDRRDPRRAARPHGDHPARGLRGPREARDRRALPDPQAAEGARAGSGEGHLRARRGAGDHAAVHARGGRARARAAHRARGAEAGAGGGGGPRVAAGDADASRRRTSSGCSACRPSTSRRRSARTAWASRPGSRTRPLAATCWRSKWRSCAAAGGCSSPARSATC